MKDDTLNLSGGGPPVFNALEAENEHFVYARLSKNKRVSSRWKTGVRGPASQLLWFLFLNPPPPPHTHTQHHSDCIEETGWSGENCVQLG